MALKKAPAGKKGKGLKKLPKAVRNTMGYKKKGGVATKMKSGGVAKKKMIKKKYRNRPCYKRVCVRFICVGCTWFVWYIGSRKIC